MVGTIGLTVITPEIEQEAETLYLAGTGTVVLTLAHAWTEGRRGKIEDGRANQ